MGRKHLGSLAQPAFLSGGSERPSGPLVCFWGVVSLLFLFSREQKKGSLGQLAAPAGRPCFGILCLRTVRVFVISVRAACVCACVLLLFVLTHSLRPPPPPLRVSRSAAIAVRPGTEVGDGEDERSPGGLTTGWASSASPLISEHLDSRALWTDRVAAGRFPGVFACLISWSGVCKRPHRAA